jgi:hypothetical protein
MCEDVMRPIVIANPSHSAIPRTPPQPRTNRTNRTNRTQRQRVNSRRGHHGYSSVVSSNPYTSLNRFKRRRWTAALALSLSRSLASRFLAFSLALALSLRSLRSLRSPARSNSRHTGLAGHTGRDDNELSALEGGSGAAGSAMFGVQVRSGWLDEGER